VRSSQATFLTALEKAEVDKHIEQAVNAAVEKVFAENLQAFGQHIYSQLLKKLGRG
jgi:hypothetical protein